MRRSRTFIGLAALGLVVLALLLLHRRSDQASLLPSPEPVHAEALAQNSAESSLGTSALTSIASEPGRTAMDSDGKGAAAPNDDASEVFGRVSDRSGTGLAGLRCPRLGATIARVTTPRGRTSSRA